MTAPSPVQEEAERLCNAGMFFAKWAAQKVQANVAAALQVRDERIAVLEAALKPFGDSCPDDDRLPDGELLAIRSPRNGRVFNYIHVVEFRAAYSALTPPVPASTEKDIAE